jgi:hypothetical protein
MKLYNQGSVGVPSMTMHGLQNECPQERVLPCGASMTHDRQTESRWKFLQTSADWIINALWLMVISICLLKVLSAIS